MVALSQICLLYAAISIGPAADDAPREDAVLLVARPRVTGVWPGLDEGVVQQSLHDGLEGLSGFRVVDDAGVSCEDDGCWRERAAQAGAANILTTRLVIKDKDAEVRIEILDGGSGRLLTSGESSCEVCANNEVREMVAAEASVLRSRIEALGERGSTLVIDSEPTGANVFLDGTEVGVTPLSLAVIPGAHDVVVKALDHLPVRLEPFVAAGRTSVHDVELSPRASLAPRLDPSSTIDDRQAAMRKRPALVYSGIGALGLGAASLATGIALIAIDGRPQQGSCPDAGADPSGRCPRMYDTRVGGIASVAVGVSAFVVGSVLLILSRRR